jgi:hypothetical protein
MRPSANIYEHPRTSRDEPHESRTSGCQCRPDHTASRKVRRPQSPGALILGEGIGLVTFGPRVRSGIECSSRRVAHDLEQPSGGRASGLECDTHFHLVSDTTLRPELSCIICNKVDSCRQLRQTTNYSTAIRTCRRPGEGRRTLSHEHICPAGGTRPIWGFVSRRWRHTIAAF